MSDPLSVIASITGIVAFAGAVYEQGKIFCREWKDCPKELRALVLEVYNLKGVLEALEPLVEDAADADIRTSVVSSFTFTLRWLVSLRLAWRMAI